jgi:hypothetical protein
MSNTNLFKSTSQGRKKPVKAVSRVPKLAQTVGNSMIRSRFTAVRCDRSSFKKFTKITLIGRFAR